MGQGLPLDILVLNETRLLWVESNVLPLLNAQSLGYCIGHVLGEQDRRMLLDNCLRDFDSLFMAEWARGFLSGQPGTLTPAHMPKLDPKSS